jgi:general secretion pathway protein D
MDKPPRQVLIEATLAEVALNNDLKYGVNWFFESGSSDVIFSGNKSRAISPVFPGFSVVHSAASGAKAALNALSSVTDVNVISSPKVMVLNNHTGMIQVGDQVPVVVRSSQGTGSENAPVVNNVEFRDTGVILNITPHINAGGLIVLEIEQEVSEVAETKSSGIDSPTIQQRKIKTTVAIQNGETIALGGLIRETSTNSKSGIPILKDIPLLGNVFSTTSKVKRRTELIILITPRIVNNVHEMRGTLDDMKQEFKFLKKFPTSILKLPETSGKLGTRGK